METELKNILKKRNYVQSNDKKVLERFNWQKGGRYKIDKLFLKTLTDDKTLDVRVSLHSLLSKEPVPTRYYWISHTTWWGKIRKWLLKKGVASSYGGWSIEYKRGRWSVSVGAGHWKDVFNSIFNIVTFQPLSGFNMHVLSLHHFGRDYMMDYWGIQVTILNFDFSIYKSDKE